MPAAARSTPPTRPTIARSRSASSCRATSTTSSPRSPSAARVRRAHSLPRRRHLARRPVLQRRRGPRLLEVHERRSSRSIRRGALRAVQPGVVLDDLRNAAEKHHLTFGPDPATHDRCTLGGMIGNNSCGVHSRDGRQDRRQHRRARDPHLRRRAHDGRPTSDAELEQIIRRRRPARRNLRRAQSTARPYADLVRAAVIPRFPRRVSGYNLDELLPENGFNVARALVGSEGTCVTVLEADVSPGAKARRSACCSLIGYPDIYQCRRPRARGPGPQADRPRRRGRPARRRHATQGHQLRRTRAAARRAAAGCWSNSARDTGRGRSAGDAG